MTSVCLQDKVDSLGTTTEAEFSLYFRKGCNPIKKLETLIMIYHASILKYAINNISMPDFVALHKINHMVSERW